MNQPTAKKHGILSLTVIVAALGYFVDIYDLQLFNLVSKTSLKGLGDFIFEDYEKNRRRNVR